MGTATAVPANPRAVYKQLSISLLSLTVIIYLYVSSRAQYA
jgi:hypothetical protein